MIRYAITPTSAPSATGWILSAMSGAPGAELTNG